MNRPGRLSLSTITASKNAGVDSASGLRAIPLRRLWLVAPALCALAYPLLLSLLSYGLVLVHGSPSPNGPIIGVSVVASLILAVAVMVISFAVGLALGSPDIVDDPDVTRARSIVHLAFATPSLHVGFENIAGVLQSPSGAVVTWLVFWALLAMLTLIGPRSSPTVAMTAIAYHRLGIAHGFSAIAILLLFVGPHIVNHTTGFWSGSVHIAVMSVVRHVYRNDIVQPLLLALIGFQILSGIVLVRRRMIMPGDFFGTVQTMCGVYIGVYFLAHMTAVFAARYADVDTNWSWLTRPNDSLLVTLLKLRLIAHYWVGPIAIFAHVSCGLRWVLLQRDVLPATANRIALALIAVGVVTSSVILLALFNVHIA